MKKYLRSFTWLFLAGLAGVVLFHTSYQSQTLEERLGKLNQDIIMEQQSLRVLKAEWSYLNDPARLERLAKTHLNLQPTKAAQFASLDDIPEKITPETSGVKLRISQSSRPSPLASPSSGEGLILASYKGGTP